MNKNNPYSISEIGAKEQAKDFIKDCLHNKNLSLEQIENSLNNALISCNRKIKRNSFNIEAIGQKFTIENRLKALNYFK